MSAPGATGDGGRAGGGGRREGGGGRRGGGRRGGGEARMVPDAQPRSYYGRAILKQPVWTWEVPVYFFVGGMAGASAPLSLAARLRGNDALARSAAAVALGGAAVSPVLLISDLGRPERFLHMLRMFKPTSPMSVGSWILAGFGPAAALGAGREWLNMGGGLGRVAQVSAAMLGPALSTYTAALLANTSVPAWNGARRELPFVFAGGSLQSAGAAAVLITPDRDAAAARRMTVAGAAIELASLALMERRLDPRVAAAYKHGRLGLYSRLAGALTVGGATAVAFAGRGRRRRRSSRARIGAAALLAGAALERWTIFKAGSASAADPAQTVAPQRERAASAHTQPPAPQRAPAAPAAPAPAAAQTTRSAPQ